MEDIDYLEMCVGLAEKNKEGRLNISVAAMIVNSTGEIISRGFKRISKGRVIHAEVDAIWKVGYIPSGSTLYTTLEPCMSTSKIKRIYSNGNKRRGCIGIHRTKHCCVDYITSSGIERVVIGVIDPSPEINGRGIDALSNRGVEVKVIDDFRERIISLNKGYFNKNES